MNKTPHLIILLVGISLATNSIGCSTNGEQIEQASVSGTVAFDGEPITEGIIRFHPEEDAEGNPLRGKAVQVKIQEGIYRTEQGQGVVVGVNSVFISASKIVGKEKQDGIDVDITEETIPEKYNTKTTLILEVKAGENSRDFILTSD